LSIGSVLANIIECPRETIRFLHKRWASSARLFCNYCMAQRGRLICTYTMTQFNYFAALNRFVATSNTVTLYNVWQWSGARRDLWSLCSSLYKQDKTNL
jgi:hypothetical protein